MKLLGLKYFDKNLLSQDNNMDIDNKFIAIKTDSRGDIGELLTVKDIKKYNNQFGHVFFVTFKTPKAIRGNHYHSKNHEYYIVLVGKVKVILIDIKSKKKKKLTLSSQKGKMSRLRIGPNIAHACYSLNSKSVMLCYLSHPYDNGIDTIKYNVI